MTTVGSSIFKQFRFGLLMLASIVAITLLVLFFPPDGIQRAEWLQFVGRLHVLAVHLPIAFILLVPVLELAGRSERLSYLRQAAGFVLATATLAAIAAAFLGWCLGRSGGYSGSLVTQHVWGGVLLTIVCWLCWLLHMRTTGSGIYKAALATSLALVVWTGYRGAQLSLGTDHLTAHMPVGLRHALGLADGSDALSSQADPHTFYGARVQPILTVNCVSCHGSGKHKADLRLDSYKALLRGGKDGAVVLAGNAQGSDLFRRITLPAGHDDFMPKGGKPPLLPDQVKVIELWIAAGASDALAVDAIKDAPAISGSPAAAEVKFEEIDPATVAKLRGDIARKVAGLQKQFPNVLDYQSRGSTDLRLNASILGTKFGDNELAAFLPIADHITAADLSRTAVTDRSAGTIVGMKRLHVLRLMNTGVTDALLLRLGGLDQLESLSVFGTTITPSSLTVISKLPRLVHFYVGQTRVSANTPVPEGLAGKLVF